MYARTDKEFATSYFWWFFLVQPAPLPEAMIEGATELYLRTHLTDQSKTAGVPPEDLVQEYLRCYRNPATVHAVCEDYRAAATTDLDQDDRDNAAGRLLTRPLLALWGADGTVGRTYNVLDTWRAVSEASVTGAALPCGHLLQEERPDAVLHSLRAFLPDRP